MDSKLLINKRQENNPVLKYVRNVAYEWSSAIRPDFLCGPHCGVLYLTLKWHKLHPAYLETRCNDLNQFDMRVRFLWRFCNSCCSGSVGAVKCGGSFVFAPRSEYSLLPLKMESDYFVFGGRYFYQGCHCYLIRIFYLRSWRVHWEFEAVGATQSHDDYSSHSTVQATERSSQTTSFEQGKESKSKSFGYILIYFNSILDVWGCCQVFEFNSSSFHIGCEAIAGLFWQYLCDIQVEQRWACQVSRFGPYQIGECPEFLPCKYDHRWQQILTLVSIKFNLFKVLWFRWLLFVAI
jgi:hypothetical protein